MSTNITILDFVKSVVGEKDSYNGADHAAAGVAILGGCQDCGATIASYNAYPSTTGFWKCGDDIGDGGFATVEEFRNYLDADAPGVTVPADAESIVNAYTEADQAWAYHTQVCADQEERFDCGECTRLNRERSEAKRIMDANPTAKALYDSDEKRAERRTWTREVFRPLSESVQYDGYY